MPDGAADPPMQRLFYHFLSLTARFIGDWFFVLLSRCVAAGYFILFPGRVRIGMDFYRAVFPHRGRFYHRYCTWRQFQNFTSLFLDRFLLQTGREIAYTFAGREHLLAALQNGRGGIILMSHMGNWEIAAHLLRRSIPDLPLMLLMGQRARDEIERLQKKDLAASGIRIIAVDQTAGSPFSLVEALSFLRSGGFVSLAGDTTWQADERTVTVDFLGHTARLPETAHTLALVSGAPCFFLRR
ncbi:lauroyl acyltransferase [Desulfosarcina cetonica]|uniref:LpxL/LpxP family acyltransferase n=1 Tax=Desulfosarcina cetonica TaxID=90730 RepID=UPI0012EDCBA8|nr:lauroyl acyltransferase [Desulfosarcina cetonica]